MAKNEVLNKVYGKGISVKKAYEELFANKETKRCGRAYFIKTKILIPNAKKTNNLLRAVFLLPVPIVILKFIVKRSKKDIGKEWGHFTNQELIELLSIKGITVDIKANDGTKIFLKTI